MGRDSWLTLSTQLLSQSPIQTAKDAYVQSFFGRVGGGNPKPEAWDPRSPPPQRLRRTSLYNHYCPLWSLSLGGGSTYTITLNPK